MSTIPEAHSNTLPHKKRGRTTPRAPSIPLDQPGRLRVANLLALLGVSSATLYEGLRTGRYPPSDGRDGKFQYWNTATIRAFLSA